MNAIENQLLEHTKKIVDVLCCGDMELLCDKLHEQVVWNNGSVEFQDLNGRVRHILHGIWDMNYSVIESNFRVIDYMEGMCLIAGHFHIKRTCLDKCPMYEIRGTFYWTLNHNGDWKVRYIHLSDAALLQRYNSCSECEKGQENYTDRETEQLIYIKDNDGGDVFVNETELYYIEAMKGVLVFYLKNGTIHTRESMSNLERRLSGTFIRIHRSYIVNSKYILRIRRYQIFLKDGRELPVPEKKYNYVKERLREVCHANQGAD